MNQSFHAWSQDFLSDTSFSDTTTVLLCEQDWNDLNRELGSRGRIFVKLVANDEPFDSDSDDVDTNNEIICCIGAPVRQADVQRNAMFLPLWILDRLGIAGYGNEVHAQFFLSDAFVEATRIVLRPHSSQFYDIQDVKSDLEGALTRVGVVERGKMVMLPLSELGGELLAFDVVATEPASVVLCQGDEVAIEFEAAWDVPQDARDVPQDARDVPVPEPEPFVPPNARQNPWRHKDFIPPYARDGKSSG
jgi:hypothetical protein